ncbi:MAG: family 16 glycosylhydrolase [Candidatus Marinimicrobia bacterium]|nr:family 16 glycosylhydrolase [Candidatus Neomarinimicrobiota bacterium]
MNKRGKLLVLILVIIYVALSGEWQVVWQDEFNTQISDDWVYETGYGSWGWGNDEWQNYTRDNAYIEDSCLVIKATVDGEPGKRDGSIQSARLKTQGQYEVKYGKIEARIKMSRGVGLWPAFWMLGTNINDVSWPACGEIDIMENVNGESVIHGTAHWDAGMHASYGNSVEGVNIEDFHNYSIIWDNKYIIWELDGKEYNRLSITSSDLSEFQQPFYILLNMAVGGEWPSNPDPSTFPAEMVIDYVRVSSNAAPQLSSSQSSLNFEMIDVNAEEVAPQTITVNNTGVDTLDNLQVNPQVAWLDISWQDNEGNEQIFDVALNSEANQLSFGSYYTELIINSTIAPPDTIDVSLQIGDNLVFNKIVKASSTLENPPNNENVNPANVNDGDRSTRWVSMPGDEEWISLNLNKLFYNNKFNISTVNIHWDTTYAEEYEIQISNLSDFSDYSVIASVNDGNGGVDRMETDSSTAGKYIRMFAKSGGAEGGYAISEIEVYGNLTTAIEKSQQVRAPDNYKISNAPNPFNPVTNISFTLPEKQTIDISVYDLAGKRIKTLFSGTQKAGQYTIKWRANDLPSGLYICKLTAPGVSKSLKMVLQK